MNSKQVEKFVMSYLETTRCRIVEKRPGSVVVKLSPEADRRLTNRPYYWSFIDRTGAEPETMTYHWRFGMDPEEEVELASSSPPATAGAASPSPQAQAEPLMGGTGANGFSALLDQAPLFSATHTRILQEELYFGSGRLAQIFDAVREGGRCITLFEEPPRGRMDPLASQPYTAWLGVNFKVGYECDMKREELYGWGISLATGNTDEHFFERLQGRRMTPKLPSNVHLLRNGLSLRKGMTQLENALERKLKTGSFEWAQQADERLQDEMQRIRSFYEPMIERSATEEQSEALTTRFRQRESEIDWQYRPRVTLYTINCGIFHLPGID